MGLNPGLTGYVSGATCLAGIPIFGLNPTPERLLITFTDLILCPGSPHGLPPMFFIVSQFDPANACRYSGGGGGIGCEVLVGLQVGARIGIAPPDPGFFFDGIGPADNIPNMQICGGSNFAAGGKAIISWGPGI